MCISRVSWPTSAVGNRADSAGAARENASHHAMSRSCASGGGTSIRAFSGACGLNASTASMAAVARCALASSARSACRASGRGS
nr:hypothetical protein HeiferVagina-S102_00022 [Bovine alphaherpesvirus 1]WHT50226.1 hypothetical protein Milk-S104_00022 [Bovine alphaherpesvirus 1]WHT50314.1 hypothetical protein Docile-S101_00022 [Bovine alphaherpesvirus 1]